MIRKCLQLMAVLVLMLGKVNSLRCYACMGTQPGCSADELEWRLVKNQECPDQQDLCVKITENLFGTHLTTRGCLSDLTSLRRDIPGDHYEGCRSGAEDIRYNKDVLPVHPHQSSVSTTGVTFCFCGWDNYCNQGASLQAKIQLIFCAILICCKLFKILFEMN